MSDLLRRGASWLTCQRDRHLAHTVVYRRGGDEVSVRATRGETEFDGFDDGTSLVVERDFVDFLISADQIVIGAQVVQPQEGDEIDEVIGDVTVTYEVRPPFRGSQAWEWSDQCRSTVRLHCKRVGEV